MAEVKNIITKEKLEKYFSITHKALEMVNIAKKDESRKDMALDFLDMATRYFNDAKYFYSNGDYINAFAAINYAHGWLDSGARSKLFLVKDSKLFTVDDD